MISINAMLAHLCMFTVYCVNTDTFSNNFDAVISNAFSCDWYKYPRSQKRQLLLFLTQAKTVKFSGLGIILLERGDILKVWFVLSIQMGFICITLENIV